MNDIINLGLGSKHQLSDGRPARYIATDHCTTSPYRHIFCTLTKTEDVIHIACDSTGRCSQREIEFRVINKPKPRLSDKPYAPDEKFKAIKSNKGFSFMTLGTHVKCMWFNEQETRGLHAWLGDLLK